MVQIKKWLRNAKVPFIMTILNFPVLILSFIDLIKWNSGILEVILINLPFILCLIITVFTNLFNNKKNVKYISNFICALLVFLIPIYYIIISFDLTFKQLENPIIEIQNYSKYYNNVDELKKVFPKKIPKNAKNVEFKYYPGLLQGGIEYSLYYIEPNMDVVEFNDLYKNKSEWIGRLNDYTQKNGLLSGLFNSISINSDKNEFRIYLIESHCDDSGYCNHGNYLLVAINEKTKEIVYAFSDW